MSEPQIDEKTHPLAAFTHRDFRPDHQPIEIEPGIPIGPIDPRKAGRLLCKTARKHAPNPGVSKAGTGHGSGTGKGGAKK